MTNKNKAIFAIILGCLFGAANAPAIKIGLREIPSTSYVALRLLIAFIVVLPFICKDRHLYSWKVVRKLLLVSLLASANTFFFVLGVERTQAGIGQFFYAAVPLIAAIILSVRGEVLSKRKLVGVIIGFLGVFTVLFLPFFERGNPLSGHISGNLLIGLAVVAWSFYMVYSQKLKEEYSPLVITNVFIMVTSIVLLPFLFLDIYRHAGWWHEVGATGIGSVAFVAIFGTVAVYLLHQYAIRHGGALVASMLFYLLPLLTFVVSFFLIGERVTIGIVGGALVALFGVYLVTGDTNSKK